MHKSVKIVLGLHIFNMVGGNNFVQCIAKNRTMLIVQKARRNNKKEKERTDVQLRSPPSHVDRVFK